MIEKISGTPFGCENGFEVCGAKCGILILKSLKRVRAK